MITQTIEKLSQLKLFGFITALDEQQRSTQYQELSFDERLSFLVEQEFLRREHTKMTRRISAAKLKTRARIEEIDFSPARNLKKSQILDLAQGNWIKQKHNLIITGPTGVGKTFLSCALADKACKLGFSSLYIKTSELHSQLSLAQADGSFAKTISRLSKLNLLILDEWLRDPLKDNHVRDILDLVDDRFRNASTIFISQVPIKDWHAKITDPTLADALLDRIIHDSLRVELTGESLRKTTASIPKASLRSD